MNYWRYLQKRLKKLAQEKYGKENYIETLAAITGCERQEIVLTLRESGIDAKRSVIHKIADVLGYEIIERISKKENTCN